MKEIITAESAGFCFGVERAVNKVYEEIEKGGEIYTYGEIIHNELVVGDLEKKGVRVLKDKEDLAALEKGTVIIRSHGVPKDIYDILSSKPGIRLVDATCPFVSKIHDIVREQSEKGRDIIVIGDASHPEVEGIVSYATGDVKVIKDEEEAQNCEFERGREVCAVAQTTFNLSKFEKLVEILRKKSYSIYDVNTVCSATRIRQEEARSIASKVDAMIVIGSRKSSNTGKLYDICRECCAETYLIQTLDDLNLEEAKSFSCVGITAGASTPKFIIEEVQNYVRRAEF